jgi:hypothetical protein
MKPRRGNNNVSVKQFFVKYNLWISIALGAIVGPLLTYIYSGQVFTWRGMIGAVIAGAVKYYATEMARDQGQLEGAAVAKGSTAAGSGPEAKPGDPYNF